MSLPQDEGRPDDPPWEGVDEAVDDGLNEAEERTSEGEHKSMYRCQGK